MSERDIFTAARAMTDPAARSAYLDRACGGDAGVKARVEALLRAHDQPDSLLDRPALDPHELASATTQAFGPEGGAAADDEVPLGFLATATRPDSLGRIGHYEALQVLGQGGFGIVFRAFDDVLQRVVAVKVLSPQMAATSPARKRFLREARSSAKVRHENVVQVYEVGETPLPYIAMEFIPGETLQQRLDRIGPVEPAEVVRVGRQIAEGLAAAHANGLIHRDIKPGNVLLEGGTQKVKITDFGLARAADDASISQSGIIAGTPMYMAPEQALGLKLDQRADLFSLGSVLYQMAAGRPPFRANGAVAVLRRVADDIPRDIREIIPETPQWLCDIIARLQAKHPEDRFQSAREVADLLADCEDQLKSHTRPKDLSRIPESRRATEQTGRLPRTGWWKWVAAAAVVLACSGAWFGRAGMLILSNKGELEFLPREGLVAVIVLQNDEGVIDGNKYRTPVTDWLDMKQHQKLNVPPGRYQVNVVTWPAGTTVEQWEVNSSGLFGSSATPVPVVQTSAIITVGRGDRVTLRPKIHPAEPVHSGPEIARSPVPAAAVPPPLAPAPFTDSDVRRIAALPAEQQVEEVRKALKRLNPRFDGTLKPKIENDVVTEVSFNSDEVDNIAPVRALRGLTSLDCRGTYKNKGKLSDLSPLKGMSLSRLDCSSTQVANLTPLAGMPLTFLHFNHNPVSDFTPLRGMTLEVLGCAETKVSDLSPLKGMRLHTLGAQLLPVTDLTPLQGMPLKNLDLYGTMGATDLHALEGLPLEDLNLQAVPVSDLSALKGMTSLRTLSLAGNATSDLTPLLGLRLNALILRDKEVSDLSPLKGMPLARLEIYGTGVTDLKPLAGMKLLEIRLTPRNITQGLETLREMKSLNTIGIDSNRAWPAAEFWERYDKREFKE